MIFGSTQYWAPDAMQWKLNAEREETPAEQGILAQEAAEKERLFAVEQRMSLMQAALDRECQSTS